MPENPITSSSQTPPSGRVPKPITYRGLFWCQFAATFLAVLLAGTLLAIGVRAYLRWSVHDEIQKVREPSLERPFERPTPEPVPFDAFPAPKPPDPIPGKK